MKNCIYILTFFLLLISGCKKADNCSGVICENGGSCENGDCICINGFTGIHCEAKPHYPNDSVEGNYLVTSYHNASTVSHNHDTSYTTYNDTLRITRIGNDSIFTNYISINLGYDSSYSDTSVNNFNQHIYQGGHADYWVMFFKNNPDSVHANFYNGSLGGRSGVELFGKKIH